MSGLGFLNVVAEVVREIPGLEDRLGRRDEAQLAEAFHDVLAVFSPSWRSTITLDAVFTAPALLALARSGERRAHGRLYVRAFPEMNPSV
jgi:hypothetical protein